jgi:carboxypeptidase C (cathepsin A)
MNRTRIRHLRYSGGAQAGGDEEVMRPLLSILAAGAAALLVLAGPVYAEGPATEAPAAKHEGWRGLPADSVTRHDPGGHGGRLAFTATAGSLPLADGKGKVTAKIYYTAYVLDRKEEPRPITFVFNGGPGAASAFLHIAALGPRVINFTAKGTGPVQPVRLASNPDSWIGFTDLVFIDPPGTGFSRATATDEEAKHLFYGPESDADAMADIIRLYLERNGRSLAPVFLTGESYGGFRALLVAKRLLRNGIQVRGAILISPMLERGVTFGDDFLPHALRLPSIAAASMELRTGAEAPLDFLHEAEQFTFGRYLPYLLAGSASRDTGITSELERFTGVDRKVLERHQNRISSSLFTDEYQRRTGRLMSRYDGTVTAAGPEDSGPTSFDPVLDVAVSVLAPAMVQYTAGELGFRTDLPYLLLNRDISRIWDRSGSGAAASALDELEEARVRNPALRVLIAHGYTDLVTTYGATRYLLAHLPQAEGTEPVTLKVYRGGHMMYLRRDSRRQLQEDARKLYQSVITAAPH